MERITPSTDRPKEDHAYWRSLRLLAVYRLLVAMVVLGSVGAGIEGLVIEVQRPQMFLQMAVGYFVFALVMLLLALQWEHRGLLQACAQTLGDVLLLTVLVYAAGLENTALGVLLLVAVAGGATLVPSRIALFFAAVGSLALLFQHWMQSLQPGVAHLGYTQVGLLGVALFIISLSGNLLARRARESQALAEQRGVDLANLEALSSHIVQRLNDGVLVLDASDRVRLLNDAAREQLGLAAATAHTPRLGELSAALAQEVRHWRQRNEYQPQPLALTPGGMEVQLRLLALGPGRDTGVLILLEDLAELRAQVQQAKLASLGRLAGSIAHEIRNPLSAMTHAAQLLEESPLPPADRRLLGIIRQQGRRLNELVESVLGLSRRQLPQRQAIALRSWLEGFREQLRWQTTLGEVQLDLDGVPAELRLAFDPGHLEQVVSNLVHNSANHGKPERGAPVVRFTAGTDGSGRVWVDIRDNGPGVPPQVAEQLFEPFFTTSRQGTGLGLYLCRELCESNQARLALREGKGPGACFRITAQAA